MLSAVEKARLALPKDKEQYSPAALYNKVSDPLMQMETSSGEAMDKLLTPIEQHLVEVISRSNERLTAETLQKESVACG